MYDPELRIETARLMLRQPRMAVWRHLMTAVGSWTVMGFAVSEASLVEFTRRNCPVGG